MKLKLLVKLGEWILGRAFSDEEPRADMYLPIWLLAFALVLLVAGICLGVYAVISFAIWAGIATACSILLGTAALLCWKNQSICMLPNDSFEYTTFLGKKSVYRFTEIKGLRRNNDSMTLLVGEKKVHIESVAILSAALVDRINRALRDALYSREQPAEPTEADNYVIYMYTTVCKKCDYGNAMERLNAHERIFFVVQVLEQEVNNGGFAQFFSNSSGNLANEVVDAFTQIGAPKTAEICKRALAIFHGSVPTDPDEREKLLDSLNCDDVLSACDDSFYDYEEDLEALNRAFIMKYREFFDQSDTQ